MSNINENYIEEYIRSITPKNDEFLVDIENYAKEYHVPIIEPEVAQFIKVILKSKRSKNILEIGTAIGYSSLIMAQATDKDTKITTIERREDMVSLAKENISKTAYKDKIKILQGDAEDILPHLNEEFDFIFIDAAKGQYLQFFDYCRSYLIEGGMILSDNVLYKGMVATDKLLEKRKKTIVKRLRRYLEYINGIPGYTSSILPLGDGVALTIKEETN